MSLRKMFSKIVASVIAVYMLIGYLLSVATGINQVTAEDVNMPQPAIQYAISKYSAYNNQAGKGVALKVNLNLSEDIKDNNAYQVIKETNIEIMVPKLNEQNPERVSIVKKSTALTNGNIKTELNQNYDMNSGLLTMSYGNENAELAYQDNAKDEFEMIYIYPETAYIESTEKLEIVSSVKATLTYMQTKQTVEKVKEFRTNLQDKNNGIVEIETINTSDVYDEYLKANKNEGVSYTQKEELEILDAELVDEIIINEEPSKIVNKKQENLNATIAYQSTTIEKSSFDTILGMDGFLEVYTRNEKYATLKYSNADENGDRKYIIEYSNGEQKETDGKIEYDEEVSAIKMITSKPVSEGTIELTNEKIIKAENLSEVASIKDSKSVEAMKQIIIQETIVDENGNPTITEKQQEVATSSTKEEKEVEIKHSKTKVDIAVDNQNLSVLTENKMNITVTLRTDDTQYKLFKNPIIQVELPDGIEKVSAKDVQLLYGEGTLKIKKATLQNNKILTIEIEGTQNKYNIGAIQEGASIIIPLTVSFNKTTPSTNSAIRATVNNNGEVATSDVQVKLISKTGLMAITKLSGYNGDSLLTLIDNQKEDAILEVGKNSKKATMQSTIVNNAGRDVSNVAIVGRISESDEINLTLSKEITANKKIDIYYSENKDAQITDASWTKDVEDFSTIKSYMLKIDNMKAGEHINFEYTVTIPGKLEYNKQTEMKYSVYCDLEQNQRDSDLQEQTSVGITFKTANMPNVSVEVKPNISLNYIHEGQIVEYIIKVKNEGNQEARNIIVEDIIPENATYTEYTTNSFDASHSQGGFEPLENVRTKEMNIDKLAPGETKEISIFLQANSINDEAAILENIVNVKAVLETTNEVKTINTASNQTEIRKALLDIEIKYMRMSNEIEEGEEILFYTYITNISNEEIQNITVTDALDKDIVFNSDRSMGENIANVKLDENNVLTFDIEKIAPRETFAVLIPGTLVNNTNYLNKVLRNKILVSAKGIEDHESNTIYYNAKGSKVSVEMNSSTKTNVLEGEKITYNIILKNEGSSSKNINLRDELPENFIIDTAKITNGKETITQESIGNIFTYVKRIEADSMIEIVLEGRMLDIGNNSETELNNVVYVDILDADDNIIKTIQTEPIVNIVEKNTQGESGDTNKDPDGEESLPPIDDDTPPIDDNNPESKTYTIRGLAWLDANKNGQKDSAETLLPNVHVMVINADTNQIVKNTNGENYVTTTGEDGTYVVNDLEKGNYILLFEYDTNTYTVTVYKKSGVDETVNSDVINKNITMDGQTKLVALTDTLEINETGISNVNIGLIENATFDLSINKYIDKVDVVNSQGTETYTWDNEDTAKVDLVAKYINTANVVVDYKFVITNNGDVTGYVDKLIDDLPSGLEFSSELNKDWYKDGDGQIATTSLSGIKIEPGKTSEIHLILTKSMTEDSTGTIPNTAGFAQISNLEQIAEKDEALANNESSAVLILSIKTGSPILYLSITLGCMIIIAVGAYIIKKKVLKGNI